MQYIVEFFFDYGLLGDGVLDVGFIGIEIFFGVFGDSNNIKLCFDLSYMKMVVDGVL